MQFLLDLFRNNLLDVLTFLTGVCLTLAVLVLVTSNISRSRKTAIFLVEISSALIMTSIRFTHIYEGVPGTFAYWMAWIFKFFDMFFTSCTIFSINFYVKDLFKYSVDGVKNVPVLSRVVDELLLADVAVLLVLMLSGNLYPLDETHHYIRTSWRYVTYVIPLISIVLISVSIFVYRRRLRKMNFVLLLYVLFGILGASVFQFFTPGLPIGSVTTVDMAILLYVFEIFNLGRAVERAHRLEIEMMAKYQRELEITVDERTRDLKVANEKAERLLLNILPEPVAKELTEHPDKTISQKYPNATVLFTDIVGFTKMSSGMSAEETVKMLNGMTSLFDERAEREGIEKIKTIGDAYMAVSGLSVKSGNDGAVRMIKFAQGLLEDVKKFNSLSPYKVQIRVGINSGNLVAGVIGKTKFIYDVWGDTVNVASRMESTGEPMRIHVSEFTWNQTKEIFPYGEAVEVAVKGKGLMKTFFL